MYRVYSKEGYSIKRLPAPKVNDFVVRGLNDLTRPDLSNQGRGNRLFLELK